MSKQETILCIYSTLVPIAFLYLVFGMNISGRTVYEVVIILLFIKLLQIISEAIYRKLFMQNRKGGN